MIWSIVDVFVPVAAALDEETMTMLNASVDVDGNEASDVARDWLTEQGLIAPTPDRRCSRTTICLPGRCAVGHPGRVLDDADAVLAAARAGSADAFTAIYTDLAGPVAAYVRTKGVRDAEDVTSEVFLAVFTGLARFEGDETALRSWIFTIAHRRVIDGWRRSGRRPDPVPYEPDRDERTSQSAEGDALDVVGQERALALLGMLTEEQRDVLALRIVADLTVEEVAVVVGRKPGAVKALQRRGLANLRRILEKEDVPL